MEYSPLTSALVLGIILAAAFFSKMLFSSKKWDPRGRHCFVTGGSSGAGLALAVLLVKRGAHVSIVARNEERLQAALAELEKHRQTSEQIIKSYSFAVNSEAGSAAALHLDWSTHPARKGFWRGRS